MQHWPCKVSLPGPFATAQAAGWIVSGVAAIICLQLQFNESWQELLYTLELTIAGADDLPWLDTLNFFWDSLPDADKVKSLL